MPEFAAFISYARQDQFLAERIKRALEEYHLRVFQDLYGITPGESFREEISAALQRSQCMVLVVSKHAVASEEVLAEVEAAVRLNLPIIPVVLDRAAVDEPNPLQDLIADKHYIYYLLDARGPAGKLAPIIRAVRRRWKPSAPVIAFSNLKGGVGKTTLAAHLSSCLSHLNQLSILLIDLDPQSNLSQFILPQNKLAELIEHDKSVLSLFETSLVHNALSPRRSLFEVSTDQISEPDIFGTCEEVESSEFARLVQGEERKPVYIIPGQFELVKYTLPGNGHALHDLKGNFRRSIEAARREFDVIIIDLNPSSSFMIECALTAATHVVCPVRPDKYSVQGLTGLNTLIDKAFGLASPPQILPIFNGVPVWDEDIVEKVGAALSVPERLGELQADKKSGPAVAAIAKVLSNPAYAKHAIRVPIPETPMLKAYHEAKSGGLFSLGRFDRGGAYGARLGKRLMAAAKDISFAVKADSLNDHSSIRSAEETEAHR